jgi:hypothetical protein
VVTFLVPGTCTIDANQAGDSTYAAAPTASQSFTVNGTVTTLVFTPVPTKTYGDASFAVSATSASSGAVTYTVMSGPATISGNLVTVTGPGAVMLRASQAAAGSYDAATAATSFPVLPATLAVGAVDAARVYGTANPLFTGSIAGAVNGDSFTESYTTPATPASNAGTYAIVPAVAGTNLSDYTVQTIIGTLTITRAASSLALNASAGSVTPGQSLTLTAQASDVSSESTGTPTGTVTFFDGTTQLGTGTLANGVANFSTSVLTPSATHSLTASYSGDTNFMASNSSAATTVSVGTLGFSFTLTGSASQTVVLGSAAPYNFQVSPTSGAYPGTVSFTATGLPKGATAIFSPSTIAANGGAQSMTMTVQTAPTATSVSTLFKSTTALGFLLVPLLGLRRRKGLARLLCVTLLLLSGGICTTLLSGCGSRNGFYSQTQQSYSITVTATSGTATQTSVVTLVVE